MKEKAIFCWSGGKDSALALFLTLQEAHHDVRYLLTTVNAEHHRISMHGVREALLEEQAAATGIPLLKMYVKEGTNAEYEGNMHELLTRLHREEGISTCIFGDIFLEDLRAYREQNLAKAGFRAVFPLWKKDTRVLTDTFLGLGFKTITCCTYDKFLGKEWCGRLLDEAFVRDLPGNVDPCGENGEFHTFCFDGPLFSRKISVAAGEKVYRSLPVEKGRPPEGFWFCELETV
jgi:uncharacterized protein (TIGR00290 family)